MYTVKQVAEMTGISVHTLRFYDQQGLFPHVARDRHNVRLFSERDVEWVRLIQCLRGTGMPLAEIREYIHLCLQGDPTIPRRYEMLQRQLQRAEQELAAMEQRINLIRYKVEYYNKLLQQHQQDLCNPLHRGPAAYTGPVAASGVNAG